MRKTLDVDYLISLLPRRDGFANHGAEFFAADQYGVADLDASVPGFIPCGKRG